MLRLHSLIIRMASIIEMIRGILSGLFPVRPPHEKSVAGEKDKVMAGVPAVDALSGAPLTFVHPAVMDRARHYWLKMPTPTAAERMPRARLLVSFVGKYGRPETALFDAIAEHTDEALEALFAQDASLLETVFGHSPNLVRKFFWMSDGFLVTLFRHEPRILQAVFGHSNFVLERLLQHSDGVLKQMAGKSGETLCQLFRHDDRVVEKIWSPSDSVMVALLAHDDRVLQTVFGHANDFYLSNLFSHDDRFLSELFRVPGETLNSLFGCDDYMLDSLFAFDAEQVVPFLRDLRTDAAALGDSTRIAARIADLEQRLRGGTPQPGEDAGLVRGVLGRVGDEDKRDTLAHFYARYCRSDPSLVSRVFDDGDALAIAAKAISAETLDDMLALPSDVLKAIFSLPTSTFHALFGQGDTLLGWIFLYPSFVTRRIFVRSPESVGQLLTCPEPILRKLFQHHDTVLEKLFGHSDVVLGRVLSHQPETLDWLFSQSDRVLWNLFCHSEAVLAKVFSLDEGVLALTLLFTADDAQLLQMLAQGDDELKQMFSQLYAAPTESLTVAAASQQNAPTAVAGVEQRLRLDRLPLPAGGAAQSDVLLRALRRESVAGADLLELMFSHSDPVLQKLFEMPNTTLAAVLMLPPDVLRRLFWYPDRTLHAMLATHDPLVERAFFGLSTHALRRILSCADDVIGHLFNHSDHVLLKIFDCHDAILINLFSHSADVLERIFTLPDQTLRELFLSSNTMLWEMSLRSDEVIDRLFACPDEAIEALFQCDKLLLEDLFAWEDDVLAEVINFLSIAPLGNVEGTIRRLLTQTRIVDPEYAVKESEVKDAHARALISSLEGDEHKQPFLHYYGKYADIRPAMISLVFERSSALYDQMLAAGTNVAWHLLSLPPSVLRAFLRHEDDVLAAVLAAPGPIIQRLFSDSPLVFHSVFKLDARNLRLLFAHREGVLNTLFGHADAVLVALFSSDELFLHSLFSKSDDALRHLFGYDTAVLWNLLLHDPSVISRLFEADDTMLEKLFTEERRVLVELFSSDDETLRDFVAKILRNPTANFRAAAQEIGAQRTILHPDCYEQGLQIMALSQSA